MSAPDTAKSAPQSAYFGGELELPGGVTLAYSVALEPNDDAEGYRGTIDIPAQNVIGAALNDVVLERGSTVEFSLPVPGTARWHGTFDDSGAIACSFEQGPVKAPCTMTSISQQEHIASAKSRARPQTPVGPFPYASREVSYRNESAGITISGTLTVPDGNAPYPAALLITGSGAQDRDETILDHKPFFVLADQLTKAGVAVLRVDDRGIGGTDAGPPGATTTDFAGDVRAGLAFLRTQSDIDAARLGLIGHSEGGIIAPIVAAQEQLDFVVLMAGTGVPGREVLALQVKKAAMAEGRSEELATRDMQDQEAIISAVLDEPDAHKRGEKIRALLEQRAQRDGTAAPTQAELATTVRVVGSPWFRQFLTLDPAEHLRRVRCSVLVLNGDLDVQVDADQNVAAIERALREGGNRDVTVKRLPGLNHLFQRATTGAVSEYGKIEHTFDTDALEFLTRWVVDTTAP